MTKLSSNWSRLQKQINPKSIKSKKKSILKTDKDEVKKEVVEKTGEEPVNMSVIQAALWSKERDIQISDLEKPNVSINTNSSKKRQPGKYLAIDCEFVGVGPEGKESALARVSIVNFYGYTIYDEFVKPRETVTDWRTWVSGITPKHMNQAISFKEAQNETARLLKDKILVGHAVHHDLEALFLSHPKSMIRDTTQFKLFRSISNGKTPGLKKLTKHFLKIDIQDGQHSSVEDARATMLLFRLHRKDFEKGIKKFDKSHK
ncbi:RNA exonuclease 4 [[Candida] jaroonii]|uniref:RNA exonuclease 4 n=1 Tax=[Candida] jaroonii TaxID=467808 RepID=A0ACA9Y3A4_9ASCO|nr:RNA exonuclease 4 [[Candida] jaroonii]